MRHLLLKKAKAERRKTKGKKYGFEKSPIRLCNFTEFIGEFYRPANWRLLIPNLPDNYY